MIPSAAKTTMTATARSLTLILLLVRAPQVMATGWFDRLFAFASPSIPPPPPISMPVWSLASPVADETSMNIVTFATPVSVAPPKLWVVSLYTNTMTRQSFLGSKVGVLQLLTPSMQDVVQVLGKRSGYEEGYSKRDECQKLGHGWISGGKQCFTIDSDIPNLADRYVVVLNDLPCMKYRNDIYTV